MDEKKSVETLVASSASANVDHRLSSPDLEKKQDSGSLNGLSSQGSTKGGFEKSVGSLALDPEKNLKVPKVIQTAEDDLYDTNYPTGLRFYCMTSALCITIALVALDSTIVSTAIPTLVGQWDSLAEMGWYGAAYALPQPTLQPSFGKLYPYFNTKYMFLAGLCLFEIGSLICGLAQGSINFIMGRTVAGIGAAILAPGMMLILIDTVPRPKRPLFTGLLAAAGGIAACLGPFLGGTFTTHLTWRWCFWINLPLGFLSCCMLLFFYVPKPRDRGTPAKEIFLALDPLGCLMLTGSVLSILLAMTFATESSWSKPDVIALLVLTVVFLLGLVVSQLIAKPGRSLLPGRILKNKGILLCAAFGFLVEMGSTSHVYYLPFYFQGVKGASAAKSGVDLLPYLISQTVAAVIAGVSINRSGYFNPAMLFGTALFCVGAGLLHTIGVHTPSSVWIGYQVLSGFGTGCAQFMAMGIAQQLLEKQDESIGLSMVYMIKTLGQSLTVSICSTIFYSKLKGDLATAGLNAAQVNQVLLSLNHLSAGTTDALKAVAAHAVAGAIKVVFYVAIVSGICACGVAVVTKWRKIQKPEDNPPAVVSTSTDPIEKTDAQIKAEKDAEARMQARLDAKGGSL